MATLRQTGILLALLSMICFGGGVRASLVLAQQSLPLTLRGIHRIVFLGDSITYAGGYVEEIETALTAHYPQQNFEIINVGLPSETLSGLTEPNHAGGAFPRPDLHERLERVLSKTKPDLVVACYGMNDGIYYPLSPERFDAYKAGYLKLAARVKALGAKLCVLTPAPFDSLPIKDRLYPAGQSAYPSDHPFEGYDAVLTAYSNWLLSRRKSGWDVIDLHGPMVEYRVAQRKIYPQFTYSPDGVHPDAVGHHLMATGVLKGWKVPLELPLGTETIQPMVHERQSVLKDAWLTETGHNRPGMNRGLAIADAQLKAREVTLRIRALIEGTSKSPYPGRLTNYHGFARYDFRVDGCDSLIVVPKSMAPGKPWIWRAEFFDHRPEADLALLSRGFHLVYIQVGNTFGCPDAMAHWDAFYKVLTTQFSFSRRPALEGLSRGGLYAYNWAATHPEKVSCIYGDAPVCDFKSWPGGKGKSPGSREDWAKLIQDYHFTSEAAALAYDKNPIDNLKSLARAHVPLIHVVGDADDVVPIAENTLLLKSRYEKLGGTMELIIKSGVGHHPHGLDDPTLVVEFVLQSFQRRTSMESIEREW